MKSFILTHRVKLMVFLALAWTVYNWSGVKQIKHELHRIPVLVGLTIFCEVCFDLGLLLLAVSAGRKVLGVDASSGTWLGRLREARKRVKELVNQDSTTQMYRWGLALNWFGAATVTGIIPIIAVVVLLPLRDWSLLALPVIDLCSTFALRAPLLPRLREADRKVSS